MARAFNLKSIIGDTGSAMTAVGTTQATAAELTAGIVAVGTVTSAANGVKLRAQGPGTISIVSNEDSLDDLLVYPWTSGTINGETANLPLTLPSGRAALFVEITATKIAAIY